MELIKKIGNTIEDVSGKAPQADSVDKYKEEWEQMITSFQDADEFWEYSVDNGDLAMQWGIALVRNGEVVSKVAIIQS